MKNLLKHKTFKTMKFLTLILVFACFSALGQEYKTDLSSVGKKKVTIYLDKCDFDIVANSGSELVITTDDEFEIPERAKGLKPLYNSAEDNTGIGLEVEKSESGIVIKKATGKSIDYIFKIPKDFDVAIELGFQSGDVNLDGFAGEIDVKSKSSDVFIKNSSGPISVNSISGDIVVKYSTDNIQGPTTLNTVSGEVDVSIPGTAKLDLELNTVTGEVYVSDPSKFIKDNDEDEGLYHIGGQNMKTKYNGGGQDLNLISVSGNIYLREK